MNKMQECATRIRVGQGWRIKSYTAVYFLDRKERVNTHYPETYATPHIHPLGFLKKPAFLKNQFKWSLCICTQEAQHLLRAT